MGSNPINLTIRFLLELSALGSIGIWGWNQSDGWIRFGLAFGIPITLAAVWGIFAVPNDPSRSGKAPIPVPGVVRLVIELAIFALATWALQDLRYIRISWIFVIIVAIHYIISYDRIIWLLTHKNNKRN
jgi:hypothetical protein